jgi:fermentation-respiration switch protein FrsA (DUF1100 family)
VVIIGHSEGASLLPLDYYREACQNIDELKTEIELYLDSLGEIMGYTYGWWNSFLNYRPFDYYVDINIPILFVHGELDITVPVESTKYIQENLRDKPFDCVYIENTDHSFNSKESGKKLKEYLFDHGTKRFIRYGDPTSVVCDISTGNEIARFIYLSGVYGRHNSKSRTRLYQKERTQGRFQL